MKAIDTLLNYAHLCDELFFQKNKPNYIFKQTTHSKKQAIHLIFTHLIEVDTF